MNNLSIFGGTGFVLSNYIKKFGGILHPRNEDISTTNEILYGISTVDNYNIYTNPHLDINTNLTKLMNVLTSNYAKYKSDFTFNFLSSWFVYGNPQSLPVSENANCNPKGFYSATKFCAETLLETYCKTFNIPYRIMRLANVLGVGDTKASLKKNAFQYIIKMLSQNEKISIYDVGSIRDFIWIEDCVSAINLCINSTQTLNKVINIGNGIPINVKERIYSVADRLKRQSLITEIPVPKFHKDIQAQNFYMDISFLKSLGYRQKVEITEMENILIKNYGI
jgi:nucleoside-diphosphate-sugar epimerase